MKNLMRLFASLLAVLLLAAFTMAQDTAGDKGTGQKSGAKSDSKDSKDSNAVPGAGEADDQSESQPSVSSGPLGSLSSIRNVLPLSGEIGSYVQPTAHWNHRATNNPCYSQGACGGFSQNDILGGSLVLNALKRHQQFSLGYDGGASLYYLDSQQAANTSYRKNTQFHGASATESVSVRRVTFSALDQFSYSPSATFGFTGNGIAGGFANASFANQLAGTVANSLGPSQTILTGQTSRYSNSTTGEVAWDPSLKTSFNLTASYGLLRFPASTLYDSNQKIVSAGFSRVVGRKMQIGLSYQAGFFDFLTSAAHIQTQSGQGWWGMRAGQHFLFRGSAGPQQYAIIGSPNPIRAMRWTAMGDLAYVRGQFTANGMYHHGITSGSGVLQGATTDVFQGGLSHPLARQWVGAVNSGYSRNSGISSNTTFNAVFVGASVHRALRQNVSLALMYDLQRQTFAHTCPATLGVACSTQLRHDFGIGLDWSARPIRIR